MAIDIPRIAEVAHGDVIYTLLSGSTVRQGNRSTLRLRFRVANDGRYPANLWDDSFRLAIGDQLLSPTSGLNEVVGGRTITPAIVTFDIPASAEAARLRITLIGQTAELPLDLSATGRQASDERGAPGEASSAALVSTPMRETNTPPLTQRHRRDAASCHDTAIRQQAQGHRQYARGQSRPLPDLFGLGHAPPRRWRRPPRTGQHTQRCRQQQCERRCGLRLRDSSGDLEGRASGDRGRLDHRGPARGADRRWTVDYRVAHVRAVRPRDNCSRALQPG